MDNHTYITGTSSVNPFSDSLASKVAELEADLKAARAELKIVRGYYEVEKRLTKPLRDKIAELENKLSDANMEIAWYDDERQEIKQVADTFTGVWAPWSEGARFLADAVRDVLARHAGKKPAKKTRYFASGWANDLRWRLLPDGGVEARSGDREWLPSAYENADKLLHAVERGNIREVTDADD